MTRQRRPTFYKQRWFIGLTTVIGAVGGLVAVLNGIKPYFESKPPERVPQNTEIIVDRSEGMNQHAADKTTKLDLARKAVELVLRNELVSTNLALRAFGGSCDGAHPPPTLAFSKANAERIREKIEGKGFKAGGNAPLIATILDAIADFGDEARFGGVDKRIVVVTGTLDACHREIVEVAQKLNDLATDSQGKPKAPIKLELDFIGIGMDSEAKSAFEGYAEHTGGAAHFVDNLQQLENVVESMEIVRVKRAANTVSGLLKDSVELLSPVIIKLRDKDYAAAERGLQQARNQFARSQVPVQDLGKRQASEQLSARLTEQYQRIYQAANKSRELQGQVISLIETVLSQAKASNGGLSDAWRDKYEEIRAAYYQSDDELLALLVQLDAMARPR